MKKENQTDSVKTDSKVYEFTDDELESVVGGSGYYVVDRIEGDRAVCLNEIGKIVVLDLSCLPKGIKEGDHLRNPDDKFIIDKKHRPVIPLNLFGEE